MPLKSDWKKPFAATLKAVADSKSAALREAGLQILKLARTDGIIYGATKKRVSRQGNSYDYYLETSQMDRYNRPKRRNKNPRRIFNNTKFVSRTGGLAKALTPAGGWNGNSLATRGDGRLSIETNDAGAKLKLSFTGNAEGTLRGGDSKNGRSKIPITDTEGKVIAVQTARGRRRIIENAGAKANRVFEKVLKTELDKKARGIS